jgi:pyridoxine 4-dehydrogenase
MTARAMATTFAFGGDLPVRRLGFGASRITGYDSWGGPPDEDGAIRLLRRAVESGVNFIDTADAYGPHISEELIRRALHPYRGVVVATKGGMLRTGPGGWHPLGRPEYLRQCVELSLRRLGVDRIDLYQLHRIDPRVPLADQLGALAELRDEGKIRHVGLSDVDLPTLELARDTVPVVSVQNHYNIGCRGSERMLAHCEREGIGFIPFYPLGEGGLAGEPLGAIARSAGLSIPQLALAWLLDRSPVTVPIPGTGSMAHLAENLAAGSVVLTDDIHAALGEYPAATGGGGPP